MSSVNVNSIKNLNNNVTIDISTNNQITVAANNFSVDSAGDIGLGTNNPLVAVDARNKTDGIALPRGTTAQRPTPTAGMFRWNTTLGAAEMYNGVEWVEVITDYIPTGSLVLG
jgi:hypothetical protein